MKTTSKRRVLISSVAMLLVAMLALGTATYAWFTVDTKATADGVKVQTSKMSSLLIADDTIDYTTAFTYSDVQSYMIPTSSINGTNWYAAVADAENSYKSTTTPTEVDLSKAVNKYVFVDQLNIKNNGEVEVNNVKIEVQGFNNHNYLRFALVPVSNKGTNQTITEANFRANVYGNTEAAYNPVKPKAANETATGVYSDAEADKITTKAVGATDGYTITVGNGTLAAGAEVHYNLYVWFEGQDSDCENKNAGTGTSDGTGDSANGLTFVVTGTPKTQS